MVTKRTVYIADDGKEFRTHHEAQSHDAQAKKRARLAQWLMENNVGGETREFLCQHVEDLRRVIIGVDPKPPVIPPLKPIPPRDKRILKQQKAFDDAEEGDY